MSRSNLQYLQEVLTLYAGQADALVATVRSLRRMSSLIASFVDIARFVVAATRVHQVLESVLEVSASSLGRGVTIAIDCKTVVMARFDPARVERVLHNLVGNAAHYCNQSGSIEVGARRWNDGDSIEISVTHSGPPIAHDIRSQRFVNHVRGKRTQRGMGLYFAGWWPKPMAEGSIMSRPRSVPASSSDSWARVTQLPRYASADLRSTARPRGEG